MPTVNKIFLAKLLLAVALFVGILFGVHTLQARRIPDALKSQADRAVANGKLDAAMRHLRQYLEFRPDDISIQEQLAEMIRLRNGSTNELHFLYDRILRGDPGRTSTRKEALLLALRTGRLSDAVTYAEALLKASPEDAVVWQQLASAQAGLRQFDSAKKSYETAVKLTPTDPHTWQRLAQFLIADLKKPRDAAEAVDRMVAALPNDAIAYLTRVRLDLMSESPMPPLKGDPVLRDLAKALELSPDNPDALLLQAERLQRHRDVVGARLALARGVEKHPGDQRLVRALAWLEVNRQNTAGAIGVLEDAMPHAKDSLDLLVTLADLVLDSGDVAKAEEILKKLERRPGTTAKLQAKYLRGRLAMRASQWRDAITIFISLRTDAVNLPGLETQANMLLATCYQKTGEPAKAIDSYKLVTAKDATQVSAFTGLGQLYLNDGRHSDAVKVYEAATASPYAPASAITFLLRMQMLKFRVVNAKPQEWVQLEKKIAEYAPRYGSNAIEPVTLRAELAAYAGSWPKAVAILRKESARRPQSTTLWCKLAEAVGNVEGVAAGLAVLDEAQGFVNDSAELRLARAMLYASDPMMLRPLEMLTRQTENWADSEQLQLLSGMIEIYDRVGKPCPQLWFQLASRRPNDLEILLNACGRQTDPLSRQQLIAQIEKLDSRLATFAKLSSLPASRTEHGDWARSEAVTTNGLNAPVTQVYLKGLGELTNAYGNTPDRADICLLMARFSLLAGQAGPVKAMIERAWQMAPNRFETMSARVALCLLENDVEAANRILTRLQFDPRWAGEPLRRVVQQSVLFYQANRARKPTDSQSTVVAASAVENQGENATQSTLHDYLVAVKQMIEHEPGGLGWLSKQAERIGDHADALKLAEHAVSANLATVEDWLRLSQLRGSSLNDRVRHSANQLYAVYRAAHQSTSNGFDSDMPDRAWPEYTKARLAIHQARMDRTAAVLELESFLSQKDLRDSDRAWATRNLAMLLAVRGETSDRERAAKLLTDSKLTEVGSTLADRRAAAGVLANLHRYIDGDSRSSALRKAISLMESVTRESKSPKDAFSLCRIYRAAGRSDDAVAQLRLLLQADPGNLDYLLAGLDVLMEAKQPDAAKGFAERLIQLGGMEYRVIAAVAKYECLCGNLGQAHALAESYFRTADPLAGDVPAKTARTAELHDELARLVFRSGKTGSEAFVDSAVAKYEALLPGRAESLLKIASLLAAAGRGEEAFAKLEKLQRGIPTRIVASAAVTALNVAGGNDRQFERTRFWIETAKAQETAAMRFCEAEYFMLKGDLATASAIYEAILKEQPHSVAALNNLAWLLAADPETAKRALDLLEKAMQEVGLTGELLDTRSRIRLAMSEPALAVADANEALRYEKTALRFFHLALATQSLKPAETAAYFKEAKSLGLTERMIHPKDVPIFRKLDKQ